MADPTPRELMDQARRQTLRTRLREMGYTVEQVQTIANIIAREQADIRESPETNDFRVRSQLRNAGFDFNEVMGVFREVYRDPNIASSFQPQANQPGSQPIGGQGPDGGLTILGGRETQWFFDRSTGNWYIAYGLPNSDKRVIFEAEADQMDALFGEGMRPANWQAINGINTLLLQNKTIWGGNVSQMEGDGEFEEEVDRIVGLAMDSGQLPDWAKNDPKFWDLLYLAETTGKDDAWLMDQASHLQSFKDRFPGALWLMKNYELTPEEAVQGFLEFENDVQRYYQWIGLDPTTVQAADVGALMRKGYDTEDLEATFQAFRRYDTNRDALRAFNQVLRSTGRPPLRPGDMIRFLRGEAPAEIYEIYEGASIREAATAAGLGHLFSGAEALRVAQQTETDISLGQATQAFQSAAVTALRLRNQLNIQKFGLDLEDVIDLSLGINPRSGKPLSEVSEALERVMEESRAFIQERRAKPFRSFTPAGAPAAVSLSGARPTT